MGFGVWRIRISGFGLLSAFGLRPSDLPSPPALEPGQTPCSRVDYGPGPGRAHAGGLLAGAAPRLHQLRRPALRDREPARPGRPHPARAGLGLSQPARRTHLLAPAHLGVAHAGLPVVRVEPRPAAPGQRGLAYRQYAAVVGVAPPNDRRVLAQRDGGGPLRAPPAAGRYRRLDHGTEECAEHLLLAADPAGLRALRRTAVSRPKSEV